MAMSAAAFKMWISHLIVWGWQERHQLEWFSHQSIPKVVPKVDEQKANKVHNKSMLS